MTYLLDVNVLVALLDPSHVHFNRAHNWFHTVVDNWATCPFTEAGAIRVMSQTAYRNSPGGPGEIIRLLRNMQSFNNHVFWPADLSLLDAEIIDGTRMLWPGQVTDTYLLALAVTHGGKLATFDARLNQISAKNGAEAFYLIP
jgi:uncharacterized protein